MRNFHYQFTKTILVDFSSESEMTKLTSCDNHYRSETNARYMPLDIRAEILLPFWDTYISQVMLELMQASDDRFLTPSEEVSLEEMRKWLSIIAKSYGWDSPMQLKPFCYVNMTTGLGVLLLPYAASDEYSSQGCVLVKEETVEI
jgi:hypothetical protein